jgi:hypothetical protein
MGVKPETQARLNDLKQTMLEIDAQIAALEAKHKTGELTTNQLVEELTPLLKHMALAQQQWKLAWDQAKEEGSSKGGTAMQILWSILGVGICRLLGIPGFASSSGNNFISAGRRLLAKGSEA